MEWAWDAILIDGTYATIRHNDKQDGMNKEHHSNNDWKGTADDVNSKWFQAKNREW